MVARALYFDWSFEGVEYFRVFQARVFDNRRRLESGRSYESAARFNSQIPLEYAYGAWGELPAPDGDEQRRLLEPFHVSREHPPTLRPCESPAAPPSRSAATPRATREFLGPTRSFSMSRGVLVRRRRCPAITWGARRATKGCVIQRTRRGWRRSSP